MNERMRIVQKIISKMPYLSQFKNEKKLQARIRDPDPDLYKS